MTLSKIKSFQKNLSVTSAEWNVVALDSFTQRFSDYLYQKYKLPNIIDYISLDTEGNELDIISKFNFKKYKTTMFYFLMVVQPSLLVLFPPPLPPLQLPGRPLWGVGVGREAANGVVKCVEVSAPLVPPSYTH